MAGVRVYCRGKIAAQSLLFNKGSGFQGEYSIRSYFVGELECDWLDEVEDLIQTDRRDILWSHDLGQAFQAWGQSLVAEIGKRARNPMRTRMRDVFRSVSRIKERAEEAFPKPDQRDIRDRAVQLGEMFGQTLREEEASDPAVVDPIVNLSIDLAPHLILEEKLRQAADAADTPIGAISGIMRTAQLAELYSFGRIASDRVRVIQRLETLKDATDTDEDELQKLIESAPWLIDPQWAPITANETLRTLRAEFEKYFERETGTAIALREFAEGTKRPDFVSFSTGERLHIVEIKRPHHKFKNDEMERLNTYYQQMTAFLDDKAHTAFKAKFHSFHIILVCDHIGR